jgi:hypothetical protein
VGRQFLKLMRADEVIGKHRTLFSQNPVQTPLAEQYFRNGPVLTVERLEQYLLACVKAGTLKCRDAELAANQFFSLFLGLGHIQCLLGLEKPSEAADERLLNANVDLFLKALQPTAPKIGDGSD